MAARLQRLLRRSEFLRVAAARQKWVAPGLVLQARRRSPEEAERTGVEVVRIGFTASRKVGGAVQRNRARRRLRAAVEQVMPAHAAPGCDVVVIARTETLVRPFAALVDDLTRGLKRLGVYREDVGAQA
jgi:ribonuclease P protein component